MVFAQIGCNTTATGSFPSRSLSGARGELAEVGFDPLPDAPKYKAAQERPCTYKAIKLPAARWQVFGSKRTSGTGPVDGVTRNRAFYQRSSSCFRS